MNGRGSSAIRPCSPGSSSCGRSVDALADPVVPPTTAERDAAITAALGASKVVDLDAARGQRRLRIASIAAAIVLVLGAAGFLIRAADDKGTEKFAAVAGSIGPAAGSQAAEAATANAAADATAGAGGQFSLNGRPALGSFADRSSLAAAAESQVHSVVLDSGAKRAGNATAAPQSGASSTTAPLGAVSPSFPVARTIVSGAGTIRRDR